MKEITMTCATCGKTPSRETIATKTRKVGKHVIVACQRQALVCDCGVLAWDPPAQTSPTRPWYPNPTPSPLAPGPGIPYRPYVSPNIMPSRLPSITCGTSSAGVQTTATVKNFQA